MRGETRQDPASTLEMNSGSLLHRSFIDRGPGSTGTPNEMPRVKAARTLSGAALLDWERGGANEAWAAGFGDAACKAFLPSSNRP